MLPRHPAEWYRHGDTTDAVNIYPALVAAPALATDGIAVPPDLRDSYCILDLTSIAAGAHSATIIIWGYKPAVIIDLAGVITPITDATRGPGWANIGQIAVAAAGATERTGHQVLGASGYTRLAAQVTAAVGAPSFWADFGFSRHVEG